MSEVALVHESLGVDIQAIISRAETCACQTCKNAIPRLLEEIDKVVDERDANYRKLSQAQQKLNAVAAELETVRSIIKRIHEELGHDKKIEDCTCEYAFRYGKRRR